MDALKQIETVEAIFEAIDKQKRKEVAPGLTRQIDVKTYTSEEQLEAEKKLIFQKFPIIVGAAASLENPGDYFLHDLTGIPIMVLKGQDGHIRAFLNICRHRGVRLLSKTKGHIKKNIVCPYHAWSYDTQGCLKNVFHSEGFEGVSAESHSLTELDCQVRFGLVFVVPDPELKGKYNIDSYLQEVHEVAQSFGFDTHVPYLPTYNDQPFNWKLGIEAGTEAYHFRITHAKTLAPHVFDNIGVLIEENKLHFTTMYPKKAILQYKEMPKEQWDVRTHNNLLVHIFPNTTFLIMADHAMVISTFPTSINSSRFHVFMHVPKTPENIEEEAHWKTNNEIFWTTINEDNEMIALQQESINSGLDLQITIGAFETIIGDFEDRVHEVLKGDLKLTDFQ